MSTTSETMRREGALACIEALRQLIEAAAVPCGDKAADYFTKRHDDAKAFAESLGPMQPWIEAMLIALAEYIHCGVTTGEPDLEAGWLPWAAKTPGERAASVSRMQADFDEDDAGQQRNVIFWPGRGSVAPVDPAVLRA